MFPPYRCVGPARPRQEPGKGTSGVQDDIECHHHLLCFVCFWFAKPVAAGCAPLWCPFRGEKPTPCKHECLILWLFVLFLLPLPGSWWTTRFHMCCVHPLFCVSCFPPRVFFGETDHTRIPYCRVVAHVECRHDVEYQTPPLCSIHTVFR